MVDKKLADTMQNAAASARDAANTAQEFINKGFDSARDYATVQSATLIFAFMVVMVNLVTDIIYSFIDPRVRYQ